MSDVYPLDPERLYTTLATKANVERLATALRALDVRIYTESVPEGLRFDCSATALLRSELWNLVTTAGRVGVAFKPAGTAGYEELAQDAEQFQVFGLTIQVASLDAIIRSKRAANRPKDRQDVAMLEAMRAR